MKSGVTLSISRSLPWVAAVIAATLMASALTLLHRAGSGIETTRSWLGPTPVTVYRPDDEQIAAQSANWGVERLGGLPVVVIAHGFAGSQPLMQAYALTL